MLSQTKITLDSILNFKKPWFEVLDCDLDDPSPCHLNRVNEFLNGVNSKQLGCKSLDLMTFLLIAKHKNCYVKIPQYTNLTKNRIHEKQQQVSLDSEGKIISLKSNKDTFNFSITILDKKYIEAKNNDDNYEFAPRTYTLTDYYGDIIPAWKNNFVFNISDAEKEYYQQFIDLDNNTINIDKFVNPQLEQSFYTEYYMLLKLLVERLVAERKFLSDLRKQYIPLLPKSKTVVTESISTTDDSSKKDTKKDKDTEPVIVKCFEANISSSYIFDSTKFTYLDRCKNDVKSVVKLCDSYLEGIIDLTDECKFICRSIELAFTKMNPELDPAKLHTYKRSDCKWNEQKIKFPKCRIEWTELMFKNYSILCRYHDKKIAKRKEETL